MNDVTLGAPQEATAKAVEVGAYARLLMSAAVRAFSGSGLDPSGHVISVCSWQTEGNRTIIQHVAIGDTEGFIEAVMAAAVDPGRNVYTGFGVYPKALLTERSGRTGGASVRGSADKAVGYFGLAGDLDRDKSNSIRIEDLPLAPTIVLDTSKSVGALGMQTNQNCIWLFDRLVSLPEAKELAANINRVIGDADNSTKDPNHLWRIPGCLNWPKKSKLRRGRSAAPQPIIWSNPSSTTAAIDMLPGVVSPATLRGALDVALEGLAAQPSEQQQSVDEQVANDAIDADIWNGDAIELARDLDALLHISADCTRNRYRAILGALFHRHGGSKLGREIALAWSQGGSVGDVRLQGAAHRYSDEGFQEFWVPGSYRIGTIFHYAQQNGWDARRKRWGLIWIARDRELPQATAAVIDAHDRIPRNVDFNVVRASWRLAIARKYGKAGRRGGDAALAALFIADLVRGTEAPAFVSYENLSAMVAWPYEGREGWRRLQRALNKLSADGYLTKSHGKSIGAHKKQGATFTLSIAGGWDGALRDLTAASRSSWQTSNPQSADACNHAAENVQAIIEDRDSFRLETVGTNCSVSVGGRVPRPLQSGTSISIDGGGESSSGTHGGTEITLQTKLATADRIRAWAEQRRLDSDIQPWLSMLPTYLVDRLRLANSTNPEATEVLARQLASLFALDVENTEVDLVLDRAIDRVITGEQRQRRKRSTAPLDETTIDKLRIEDIGPVTCARALGIELGRVLEWRKRDLGRVEKQIRLVSSDSTESGGLPIAETEQAATIRHIGFALGDEE
ncbi:MAG: hypothetical protein ACKVP7_13465 [Hyphomicrobiaceae bacterium]